jgi:hypothetical protein
MVNLGLCCRNVLVGNCLKFGGRKRLLLNLKAWVQLQGCLCWTVAKEVVLVQIFLQAQ